MSVIDWPSAIVWFAFPEVIDPETAQFEAKTIIDPEMVVEAMYACGVELNKTVLVGDTIYDAQCATNAGISFIGVSWGYNSSEILKQNGANMVINNFSELQTCLNILISKN